MKKLSLLLTLIVAFVLHVNGKDKISYENTIQVLPGDSHELIIEKAAHVVPTENQMRALQNEFIAFIHIGPNTFTRREWGTGMEDPSVFALETLDTDQWCEAMKAAGMKMVMITVKHHDGFVLWQSRYTTHGIMSTKFKDGKGDILKELSASCQKYGLKLGIYLSPADLYQIESPDGLYGNLSKYTKRTIPREVPGRPFANKTKFEFVVDDYNEYFLNQLFEVLTEYGPVDEVWFDGAHPKSKGGQKYNYQAWKTLIHTLAPKAVIFGREDIRWCGNEAGITRDTEWNIIPFKFNPDTASHFPNLLPKDLGSREKLYDANYLHYQQTETDTSIREGWFYRDDEDQKVRSADDIFDIYERCVGGNATFLLNIPPNREGRFSDRDVQVLKEVGSRISKTYGTNLLSGAKGPKKLLDGNIETFVDVKDSFIIRTPKEITINRIVLQEAVSKRSERVERHAVDAWVNGEWKEIAQATNIGYKRILRFPDVTTNALRVRVLESRLTPGFANITAHYYEAQPPQLAYNRTTDGKISIEPKRATFRWKSKGSVNSADKLNAGYKIYYTTDGSTPTANSQEYTAPFYMKTGQLKAVSILNGRTGAMMDERIGLPKKDWKLVSFSDEAKGNEATKAFDADASTYWIGQKSASPQLTIDLGETATLQGFAYTPQTTDSRGMIAKGVFSVSVDGTTWEKVSEFEIGNLVNDPSKRYVNFDKSVNARYVRIEAVEMEANDTVATIAELDVF